eukprot:GILK01008936.1.p1 GENE.GILK01008936.1~~GILK01008936.1.p1  ORF type:complete len:405 (-),score=94.28 GILK01008936.1:194-1369(-)
MATPSSSFIQNAKDEDLSQIDQLLHEDNALPALVRKMNIFRKALIKEKELREKDSERVRSLTGQLQAAEDALREKDSLAVKFFKENEDLREQIAIERQRAEEFSRMSNTSIFGDKKSLEIENKRLTSDTRLLQRKVNSLEEKLRTREAEVAQLRSQTDSNLSTAQDKIAHLSKDLADRESRLKAITEDFKKTAKSNLMLLDDKTRLERDCESLETQRSRLEDLVRSLQKQLQTRDEEMSLIQSDLAASRYDADRMAEKLMEYKTRCEAFELQVRKFAVIRIRKWINTPAEIVISKNPQTGQVFLEVCTVGKKKLHAMSSIQTVHTDEDPLRFSITFTNGDTEVFECTERDLCVHVLKDFVRVAGDQTDDPREAYRGQMVGELDAFFGGGSR